ncbi:MAG: methyltransferase domain-containing protein [Alphaproteobacteria bacterium]|nr:methyltransferase domain-containing protein [Alphaproteobacteria bacterium]
MMQVSLGDLKKKNWITVGLSGADHNINLLVDSKLSFFKDDSVDYVYSSHLIEHLTNEAVLALFKSVYRILKPESTFRLVAPDRRIFINAYLEGNIAKVSYGPRTWGEEVKACVEANKLNKSLLQPHQLLANYFCAYNKPANDGPLFDKAEIDKRINNPEELTEWCNQFYDEERVGGHINSWDTNKALNYLTKAGFKAKLSKFKDDDLAIRKTYSFYVEGVK